MQRHILSITFNSDREIDAVGEIARVHNCSRADVISTFSLYSYNSEAFSKDLNKWLEEKASLKKQLIEKNRQNRKEAKELSKLLSDNPELLERLKKELEHE